EAKKRLGHMCDDPAWQAACALPRTHKQERNAAFSQLRQQYGFSEYALHAFAKTANCSCIADHLDAVTAQTLATRPYRAMNRVRLLRRKASRPQAHGADGLGYRYYVQLVLEGTPYQKPKHTTGTDMVGLDLGPSTIAIVGREGQAQLTVFCDELTPDVGKQR